MEKLRPNGDGYSEVNWRSSSSIVLGLQENKIVSLGLGAKFYRASCATEIFVIQQGPDNFQLVGAALPGAHRVACEPQWSDLAIKYCLAPRINNARVQSMCTQIVPNAVITITPCDWGGWGWGSGPLFPYFLIFKSVGSRRPTNSSELCKINWTVTVNEAIEGAQ